jgi:L-asparaginase
VDVLKDANVAFESECESILRKDSLDMSDCDRQLIRDRVMADPNSRIIITHGTDTMPRTAEFLLGIPEKTIVLTGSMQPARFRLSDATFNIGAAVSAVQCLPAGVYIVMNGRVFRPPLVRKNRELNRFEDIE